LLITIAKMLCVKAELISTRLLNKQDKEDMLSGLIPIESLVLHVKVWISNQMPNYAEGSYERYKPTCELPMQRYRGNGKR
jgi:hypothetical protein